MGEGTNRVDEPDADDLTEKVEGSRDRLDSLVSELDQRRHVVARVRQILKEKPAWVVAGGAAIAALLAAAAASVVHRQRREQRLAARAQRLAQAFRRTMQKTDRVAAEDPNTARKVLGTALSAAASTLVKHAINGVLRDRR
jgi:hypothetical protein